MLTITVTSYVLCGKEVEQNCKVNGSRSSAICGSSWGFVLPQPLQNKMHCHWARKVSVHKVKTKGERGTGRNEWNQAELMKRRKDGRGLFCWIALQTSLHWSISHLKGSSCPQLDALDPVVGLWQMQTPWRERGAPHICRKVMAKRDSLKRTLNVLKHKNCHQMSSDGFKWLSFLQMVISLQNRFFVHRF